MLHSDTILADGETMPYWDESACYEFGVDEVLALEEQTEEGHGMCLAAAEHVVKTNRFADFWLTDTRRLPRRHG
jgi:glutathionylspermidine synthase